MFHSRFYFISFSHPPQGGGTSTHFRQRREPFLEFPDHIRHHMRAAEGIIMKYGHSVFLQIA